MTKSAIVHFLLDPKLVQRLDAMAADHRRSRDDLADLAIRNLLSLHEWQKQQEPTERRPMDHRTGLPVPLLMDDPDDEPEGDDASEEGVSSGRESVSEAVWADDADVSIEGPPDGADPEKD